MSATFVIAFCGLLLSFIGGCRLSQTTSEKNEPEAISLFGTPLYAPQPSEDRRKEYEQKLETARSEYANNPNDPERMIWLGRRTAYLGKYREAIKIYSEGIKKFPEYYKLYRHRGHRYITVREFDKAIADLEHAAKLIEGVPDEIEPDGLPNKYNIPTSTSHTNIWYHLGLAYYLKGDFENAARCYQQCLKFSKNDDMLCAATDWLYMTYRRLGRVEEAEQVLVPIKKSMTIYEDSAYHRRLLMYKGEISPDSLLRSDLNELTSVTQAYGIGNWYLYNGEKEQAIAIFENILQGGNWPSFGYIAAEADLKRLGYVGE